MGLVQGIATQPSWQDCSELVVRGRNESRVVGLDTSGCVHSALGSPPPGGASLKGWSFASIAPAGPCTALEDPHPIGARGRRRQGDQGGGGGIAAVGAWMRVAA